MKTKKVCLEGFKENALGRKQIMNISGGGDANEYYVYNPKTGEVELHYYISPNPTGGNDTPAGGKIIIP